jgi:hypothetical protein
MELVNSRKTNEAAKRLVGWKISAAYLNYNDAKHFMLGLFCNLSGDEGGSYVVICRCRQSLAAASRGVLWWGRLLCLADLTWPAPPFVPQIALTLPVVLYGCETWSLTLTEKHRLKVFENRVLRRIFGPKREEDGSWRKLHTDELHSLYSSPNIVRVIKSRTMR